MTKGSASKIAYIKNKLKLRDGKQNKKNKSRKNSPY